MDQGPIQLSVVIPCLNAAKFLPTQLRALARQEPTTGWEVLIADNGSSDGTIKIAERFASDFPVPLRIVDVAHRGRHHACNEGARLAHGSRLIFVDADDEVAPGFLRATDEALHGHPVVAGRLEHDKLNPETASSHFGEVQTSGLQEWSGFLPFAAGAAIGIRREAFEAVAGFSDDAAYCEDADLCWKLQLSGYPIHFEPTAVVHYRQRTSLRSMYRQHRNYGEAQAFLYRRYRTRGMKRRSWKEVLNDLWIIAAGAVSTQAPAERYRWVRRLGREMGRLKGSLEHRVLYL